MLQLDQLAPVFEAHAVNRTARATLAQFPGPMIEFIEHAQGRLPTQGRNRDSSQGYHRQQCVAEFQLRSPCVIQ
ncbi:hypothetical protein GCM10011349_08110 [Novosphingobium indicum]|uniref:Uncharacterized protein n=1 Tax=Novosphingobium indicum TaxID=462949 RepID=A0ABQ2JDR5_9SPHN|nr:hypothetical protein GCM10011349_08110 [Novosphingobium indicum]